MGRLRYSAVAGGRPFQAALVPIEAAAAAGGAHQHADFHEVMVVVRGRGWQVVNGARQDLARGDVVLVRPRDSHAFAAVRGDELHFVNVAFPSRRWLAFLEAAGHPGAATWEERPLPVLAAGAGPLLAAELDRVLAAGPDGGHPLDVVRLWTALVPILEAAAGSVPDARPQWLVRACAAMHDEVNLRGGLERLAGLAAVSRGHLARTVGAHHGCTPVEYVTSLRLAHAAGLLTSSLEPVGRIAERCGFSSQSYFGRRFLARYGVTPTAYRAQARRAMVPQSP